MRSRIVLNARDACPRHSAARRPSSLLWLHSWLQSLAQCPCHTDGACVGQSAGVTKLDASIHLMVGAPRIDEVSDLVLLTLLENEKRGSSTLAGITRLQKLLFLLSQTDEYTTLLRTGEVPAIRFEPYRMGPFTAEIYQALDMLADFTPSLIKADRASREKADDVELDRYIDETDLDRAEPSVTSDPQPTAYALTPSGVTVAKALAEAAPRQLLDALRTILREYGGLGLTELLRRVYKAYPGMTINSEIKPQLGLG